MPAIVRARSLAVLPLILLGMLLSLLVSAPEAQAATRAHMISDGLAIAKRQVGDPYAYGAAGPDRFDCSGLLYYSFRRAGFSNFPRTSSAQASFARHIPKSNLRPGDLVFFTSGGSVYHAAIFLGRKDGHVVILHSPRSGETVRRSRPWTSSWFGATLRRA